MSDAAAKRKAILEHVRRHPGVHKSLICRRLGLSWGSTCHHLRRLEAEGLVRLQSSRREVYVLPAGIPARQLAWIAHLNDERDAAILQALATRPGLRAAGVGAAVGLSARAVRRRLAVLSDVGLVETAGGYARCYTLGAMGLPDPRSLAPRRGP